MEKEMLQYYLHLQICHPVEEHSFVGKKNVINIAT